MAFFYPRTVYQSQPSFTPVIHLFNSRGSQCQPRRARNTRYVYRQPARPWVPRFEAKETDDAYVIYGDLPGLSKEQVSVEFPEAQKLVIRGTTERRATQTADDANVEQPATESAPEAIPESTAPTAAVEDHDDVSSVTTEASEEAKSVSSYQATVEDADDDDFEMVDASPEKPKEQEKPRPEPEEVQPSPEREPSPSPEQQEQDQPSAPAVPEFQPAHSEQSRVRRFARTLNFPAGVELDYESVTADLKDGLLRVVVPKVKRAEPRRIAIL